MNLIIHTMKGGVIRVEIEPHKIDRSSRFRSWHSGCGTCSTSWFSTASDQVRELGFGAGIGLVNIQRCVDNMEIESAWGKGTRLRMIINSNRRIPLVKGYHPEQEHS